MIFNIFCTVKEQLFNRNLVKIPPPPPHTHTQKEREREREMNNVRGRM